MIKVEELLDVMTDHVDDERVRRFAEILDSMPPVVVFQTPHGLLLADGYHRVAAARRLGRTHIAADVRQGTTHDALEFAIENAVATGVPRETALGAIRQRFRS